MKRGTFKDILNKEIPDGAQFLQERFILLIKSTAESAIKCNSRYVIGGHRGRTKDLMVHSRTTVQ